MDGLLRGEKKPVPVGNRKYHWEMPATALFGGDVGGPTTPCAHGWGLGTAPGQILCNTAASPIGKVKD